jgi:hypothetical protein
MGRVSTNLHDNAHATNQQQQQQQQQQQEIHCQDG